jgi:hypothetical protein
MFVITGQGGGQTSPFCVGKDGGEVDVLCSPRFLAGTQASFLFVCVSKVSHAVLIVGQIRQKCTVVGREISNAVAFGNPGIIHYTM